MPDTPEGALFGENQKWGFAAYAEASGRPSSVGECDSS